MSHNNSNTKDIRGLGLRVDPSIGAPLHQQLYENIRRRISEGAIDPGFCFPSERLIVESLGIARPTLRQAFDRLVKEGFIARRQGSGTYVQDSSRWQPARKARNIGVLVWHGTLGGLDRERFAMLSSESVSRGMSVRTLTHRLAEVSLARQVQEEGLDGLIVLPSVSRRLIEELAPIDIPKVILEIRDACPGLDHVVIDSAPGVRAGVAELVRHGHREIHFLGAVSRDRDTSDTSVMRMVPDSEVRFRAYRQGLEEAGIAYRADWYDELPFTDEIVEDWVLERKKRGKLPSSIVAFDDLMAWLVIKGARACGVDVPGQLSVFGFGNLWPEAQRGEIATATYSLEEMCGLAVQRMEERIERGGVSGVTLSVGSKFKPGTSIGRSSGEKIQQR